MIIRRIRVRRFRRFADQDLTFGPGLNVVRGRNDAGKSTLHLAFSAALFPIRPSEARSYRSWDRPDQAAGEVTLEFEAGGCRYELRKDFDTQKTVLRSDAGTWEAPKEIAGRIGALLGFESLALFRATAHIGQWQLASVQNESREIGTQLSTIMTGTDSDAVRVLRTIAEWIRRMEIGLRGQAKNPGPLKHGQDRIAALTARRERLAAEVAEIEQAAAEREQRAGRSATLAAQVAEDAALLEANRRLQDLDRRSDELAGRAAELERRLERLAGAEHELEAAGRDEALALPEIPEEAMEALRRLRARTEVLRQQVDDRPAPATGAGSPRTGASPYREDGGRQAAHDAPGRGPGWVLPVLAAAAGLAGAALAALHEVVPGAVLLAIGAAAALLARRRARAALERILRARRAEDVERDRSALRAEADEAAASQRQALEPLGVPSVEAAVAQHDRRRAAASRRAAAAQVLDGLLGGQTREAIADERRRLLVDLGAVRSQRDDPDLAARRLEPAAFQRLVLEARRRAGALDEEKAAVQRLEGRLGGRSPHDELAAVDEELAETSVRLARRQRQVEVLRLTCEVLDAAHRATIVPGRARLEELASGCLRRLSGGAYDRITVDAQTLAPRVWVGPPKEWADVSAREIGSGGVDQCYLSLRLGLVDLLAEDRRPPLFLDDPFLAYDEGRQAAALAFVRDLARGRQIFLFTCRSAYDAYADRLTVLGEAPEDSPDDTSPVAPESDRVLSSE